MERPILSFRSAMLALVILGGLGGVSIYDLFNGPGTPRQELQARTPAAPTDLRALLKFVGPAQFHIKERYAFKDWFVQANSVVKRRLFAKSSAPNVALGRDGFLFLNTDQTIRLAQGLDGLTSAEKAAWRSRFAKTAEAAAAAELPFLFVMAPNKHTVYPAQLPRWVARPATRRGRSHDISLMAREVLGSAAAPDLTTLFETYKTNHPDALLYHPTDTHWNERGASIAMQAALGLEDRMPLIAQPAPRSGDLARMLGQQALLQVSAPKYHDGSLWRCTDAAGGRLEIETIDPILPARFSCFNAAGRGERVVAFIDSFGASAIPYLASTYKQLEVIWTDQVDLTQAKALKADLVIQIIVERKFQDMYPDQLVVTYDPS